MWQQVRDWAEKPFSADMDLTRWALFTGLIIVLVVLWLLVLRELQQGI